MKKAKRGSGAPAPADGVSDREDVGAGEEFELKLDVDPASIDALLTTSPLAHVAATDREQRSVYFDTPDHALRKAGFSLRVRTIGTTHVQTIKAESAATAGLFVRPEWEHRIEGDRPELGKDTPFRGLITDGDIDRIGPVFTVAVVRRTMLVERDGAIVEVVLDRGEVSADGRADAVHEIELELKQGDPAALFALARDLDAVAPLRLGVLTKSERGYRLGVAAPQKSVKTGPLALRPGATTAAGFRVIVGACLRQFRLNEAILVRSGGAAALHQARVSLRRLRSALATFKPVVQDAHYDAIRAELRWIAGELGHARNLDVLLERVSGKEAAGPLRAERKRAYAAAQQALASPRARALMLDLAEWTAIGPWVSGDAKVCGQPIELFAATALDTHRRRLKRMGRRIDTIDDDARHEARIEAKKLRYATEFFAGLFPNRKAAKRYRVFHEALAALQSHLGDLNDLATAPIVLAELGLVGTPTAAALQPDLSLRGPLLEQAADAYDTLMDCKRFWR